MTVYVVMIMHDDYGEVVGVFSTREKAMERINQFHWMSRGRLKIEEHTLDAN